MSGGLFSLLQGLLTENASDNNEAPFKEGDSVTIELDSDIVELLQEGHGGWNDEMKESLNSPGVVQGILTGDIVVGYENGKRWCFNPAVLTKIGSSPSPNNSGPITSGIRSGDIVKVSSSKDDVKRFQEGFGGWVEPMEQCLGKIGLVKNVIANKTVRIFFGSVSWTLNPKALTKLTEQEIRSLISKNSDVTFKVGDIIEILNDIDSVRRKQSDHGEWVADMNNILGKRGYVKSIYRDGDLRIKVNGKQWTINPESVKRIVSSSASLPSNAAGGFGVGDTVKILDNKARVKQLQAGHGEWVEIMTASLGCEGRIKSILPSGDLRIKVNGRVFTYNPESVIRLGASDGSTTEDITSMSGLLSMLSRMAGQDFSQTSSAPELLSAAKDGSLTRVKKALNSTGADVNQKVNGITALHIASHKGHMDVVNFLLDSKADHTIKDKDGDTALHYAVFGDQSGTLRILLIKKADINALNNKKQTALHVAVTQRHENCLKLLLEEKANYDTQDTSGDTPIHDAIYKKGDSMVRLLLENGASVHVTNHRGFNALHHAALHGNKQATRDILTYRDDVVDMPKEDGFTALHLAALNNHVDVIDALFRHGGAGVNVTNDLDQTALHLAAVRCHLDVTKVLVNAGTGINLDATDKDGDTAFHEAVKRSSPSFKHPDISAKSSLKDSRQIALFLAERGADIMITNNNNKTAFDLFTDKQFREDVFRVCPQGSAERFRKLYRENPSVQVEPAINTVNHQVQASTTNISGDLNMAADNYKNMAEKLELQVEEMTSHASCQICIDRPKQIVFQCGHMVCQICSDQIPNECPTCRTRIVQRIKMYH